VIEKKCNPQTLFSQEDYTMKRTALYVGLTGIMTALFFCAPMSASAFQGAGPGHGPGCQEPGILGCIETLDLTEKQRADIEALRNEARAKILPLRNELQNLEIPAALFAQTLDTAELEALLTRKKNINAEIIQIRHETMIAAAGLLTPEQRTSMLERKNSCPFFEGNGMRGAGRRGRDQRPGCLW
jgi:Spy/CpxP family protein refolding chaperone